MKSFSKVIHTDVENNDVKSWTPSEINQKENEDFETIHTQGVDFFRKDFQKNGVSKSLIKNSNSVTAYETWTVDDFSQIVEQKKNEDEEWSPFVQIELPENKAQGIIEEAREKADEILRNAMIEADQIRQEAQNQGIANAKAETLETLEAVNTLINVAREWRVDMMKQSEPMVIDLIKKMAQKMFGDGLILDNVVLQQHFTEVLESARSLGDLRIYMNPADARELGPDWREYQNSMIGHKVDIISNDSIKRGGCYIQGEWGTADALVETQLNAILNQFSEVEQPEREEE